VVAREVSERMGKSGSSLFYVVVEVEFDFVSSHDGTKHTVKTFGEAMDSGDKATNKAMSAAYKYAAFQAFCIPTEGDNDADATTHEVKAHTPEFTEKLMLIAAASKENLKEVFEKYYNEYKDYPNLQKQIIKVKDQRKTALGIGQ
jgi:predicted outer membrane protein